MNEALARVILVAGLLLSGLLSCSAAPAADSGRGALEAAIQRWVTAVNAQDVATLAATMTEDVELVDGMSTVKGRDAAIRALREIVADGRLVATSREITISHDVGWHVVGLAQARKNGDVHALGQALEIWKREQGVWKLHRRMAAGAGTPGDVLTRPKTSEPVLDRPPARTD